jgi:hypothetical protein
MDNLEWLHAAVGRAEVVVVNHSTVNWDTSAYENVYSYSEQTSNKLMDFFNSVNN